MVEQHTVPGIPPAPPAPTEDRRIPLPMNVQDAIRENLPEHVSTLLRKRLEEADEALAKVEQYKGKLVTANEQLKSQLELVKLKEHIDSKEKELSAREAVVLEDARKIEITMLQIQLDAEKRVSGMFGSALMGLVRNTTFRENAFYNHNTWYDGKGKQKQVLVGEGTDKTAE
jgi:hypothetical protein